MIKNAFCKHQSIFIPFIMAGHPTIESSTKAVMKLAEVGADIIELGVPFSDPIGDGPINQRASEVAIANGVNLYTVIEQVREVRKIGCETPIILFSYLNPVLSFGYKKFCQNAKQAGADGVLMVDLPPEEGGEFYTIARDVGLEIVLLVSPTTDPARLSLYASIEPGFVYYISRLAVTGIQKALSTSLEQEILALRQNLPNMKIAVGFGISSVEQAQFVSKIADGVVIGSKLVSTLESCSLSDFANIAKQLASEIHKDV